MQLELILANNYDLNSHQFSLPIQLKSNNENNKNGNEKIEFIPDNLLVQLNSLHLGEINASDGEDNNTDDDETTAIDSTVRFFGFPVSWDLTFEGIFRDCIYSEYKSSGFSFGYKFFRVCPSIFFGT